MSQNKNTFSQFDINSLPNKILVNISKSRKGIWLADIPKYGIFTEADTEMELDYFINDLIFSFFDVPESIRHLIKYTRSFKDIEIETQQKEPSLDEIAFLKFFSPAAASYMNE